MKRVAVSELREELRAILRAVAAGEAVEVVRRGEPVAVIVPAAWDTVTGDDGTGVGMLARVVAARRTAEDLSQQLDELGRALGKGASGGDGDSA